MLGEAGEPTPGGGHCHASLTFPAIALFADEGAPRPGRSWSRMPVLCALGQYPRDRYFSQKQEKGIHSSSSLEQLNTFLIAGSLFHFLLLLLSSTGVALSEKNRMFHRFFSFTTDERSMLFSSQEQEMHASSTSPPLKSGMTHGLSKPIWGRFFVMRQSSWAFSSQSKAPSELFCGTFTDFLAT